MSDDIQYEKVRNILAWNVTKGSKFEIVGMTVVVTQVWVRTDGVLLTVETTLPSILTLVIPRDHKMTVERPYKMEQGLERVNMVDVRIGDKIVHADVEWDVINATKEYVWRSNDEHIPNRAEITLKLEKADRDSRIARQTSLGVETQIIGSETARVSKATAKKVYI